MKILFRTAIQLAIGCSALAATLNASATTYVFKNYLPGLSATGPAATAPATGPSAGPFNFTSCGVTGTTGPSVAQCTTSYAGSLLAGQVTVTGGIQAWVVPVTGNWTVTLAGAAGAKGNSVGIGGKGDVLTTTLALTQGTQIRVLVGQVGTNVGGWGAGAGGGSYVVSGTTLLAVAGGGGGGGVAGGGATGYSASTNTTATASSCAGGGGAGYSTNGAGGGSNGGTAFVNGGAGAPAPSSSWGAGGFGGGGAGATCADYGGGGGGYTNNAGGGAGGNTYSSGSITSSAATNTSDGYVTFKLN